MSRDLGPDRIRTAAGAERGDLVEAAEVGIPRGPYTTPSRLYHHRLHVSRNRYRCDARGGTMRANGHVRRSGGTMVQPQSPVPLPAVLQGRYHAGPLIGHGGASSVYRARDVLLGRDVAIKFFKTPAIDPKDLQAQEGEARLLGALNHPGLVTLLDAGVELTDAGAPRVFLVMEYVEGLDLRQRLREGPLSPLEVAYLGWDLLSALAHVHEHGIIHRDLKPANVLLAAARGRPMRGKLADFGIAMLHGVSEESSVGTTGTAAYLSPEQVEGRALGPETDIYSTGLVLLEACTGRPAYPGGVLDSALARLEGDPEIPPHLPAEIAHLLRSMTAREPAHRPTAEAAAQALREWLIRELGGEAPRRADPEAERLAAVRDYDLIGTEPDAEFDRITAFATRVFDVSVAVITVVDEARVWLKSRAGDRGRGDRTGPRPGCERWAARRHAHRRGRRERSPRLGRLRDQRLCVPLLRGRPAQDAGRTHARQPRDRGRGTAPDVAGRDRHPARLGRDGRARDGDPPRCAPRGVRERKAVTLRDS